MNSFKAAAYQVLHDAGKPLHYKDITEIASKKNLLVTEGKTPWATMNAQISMDIINNGENSKFIRTKPGYFTLHNFEIRVKDDVKVKDITDVTKAIHQLNENLSSREKGDIGEARIAELITLYGSEALTCYKPISDTEGIDLIVKKKGELDSVYIQVKTTFGYQERGFVSTVHEEKIVNKARMLIVFSYFDLSEGDLYPNLFCIPAPDFLKLTQNEKKVTKDRVFTVGLNGMAESKYAKFMIEKRELANKILEIIDSL